jgi:hypothetical protein
MLAVAYATGRASHTRQVKGDDPDEKGIPWSSRLGVWCGVNNPTQQKTYFYESRTKGKSRMDLTMMEGVGDRWEKMEGYCSTGQSLKRAVVPVEEEEEEEEEVTFYQQH